MVTFFLAISLSPNTKNANISAYMPYVVTRDHIIIILSWYYGDTLPGDGPADQQDDDPDDPTNRARPSAGFVVFLS